ncbi:endonuclease/exonuclease/phosphatase family protein [Litoricolaceae bacterium]|nr:endonuclease/exonuclease/phosphatase family protein [Litorivicinaceae bacterium]
MIQILSWNIQCGFGIDGRMDLERTATVIKEMADFEVICLQEISKFDELAGCADQVEKISSYFPTHEVFFGAAINRLNSGYSTRYQFGNLILSRVPVIQSFHYQLPQPRPGSVCKHMPRQALEIVISTENGPLRVTTTHLEYHSESQRIEQARKLTDIQFEVYSNLDYSSHAPESGPYAAVERPIDSILCGDFNSAPRDNVFETIVASKNQEWGYQDAWGLAHENQLHPATCGIFDHKQWPEGPHCRDYFFVAGSITTRKLNVFVQSETDASDHQPIMLTVS